MKYITIYDEHILDKVKKDLKEKELLNLLYFWLSFINPFCEEFYWRFFLTNLN